MSVLSTTASLALRGLLAGALFVLGCAAQTADEDASESADELSTRTDFYVIAHMTNTPAAARWAIGEGANGLEMDLRFRSDGTPDSFRHGGGLVCDCLCSLGAGDHVCSVLDGDCEATSTVASMFETLAAMPTLAVVILDTKLTGAASVATQQASGERIVETLTRDLFDRGYPGKVVISAAKTDVLAYIARAAEVASRSRYAARILFAFDQMGKSASDAACTLATLRTLPTKNRGFGTGISSCAEGDFSPAIRTASSHERAGVSGFTYVWTLDSPTSMKTYIEHGARGILTNKPRKLVEVAREMGLTLARPQSAMPTATSDAVVGNTSCGCDCDYHPGGCIVSKPAPPGMACKCTYKGLWTCGGTVTRCKDPNAALCNTPDTSPAACALGGGDCDGY